MINSEAYKQIMQELSPRKITLVAVSKTKPVDDILALYELGHRDFGENYVQELVEKQLQLPQDIRWHFIGHLQSNKVKYIASFIHLIHSVDNEKLLREIDKQALKNKRTVNCLLQIHIAQEETKFGMSGEEAELLINRLRTDKEAAKHINLQGLMGMASNTENVHQIRKEFRMLKQLFEEHFSQSPADQQLSILSIGMSSDYKIALEEGSNMLRIGSLLFGVRNYQQ